MQYFPKLKKSDGSNVIGEDGRPRRSQKPKEAGPVNHSTLWNGDRVRLF